MHKVRLPVYDAGKVELHEYEVSAEVGKWPDFAHAGPGRVLAFYYTAVVVHNDKVGAYMRVLSEPHATLPYAYFRYRDVEFFASHAGYSTALRRLMELLDLAQAVARVQALEHGYDV